VLVAAEVATPGETEMPMPAMPLLTMAMLITGPATMLLQGMPLGTAVTPRRH